MERLFKNTPLINIIYEYNGEIKNVYAKLEYFTLTGSVKDKVAYYMLKKAIECGEFKEGMPIVEVSSGNTAISLAALGAFFKSPVYIFMPNWVSNERKKLLELYGAIVKTYTKKQGGFIRCLEEANKFAKEINAFYPDQFGNYNNILAHQKYTAKEILKKLNKVDTFVTGIGTGGTISGCGKIFKKLFNTKIISVIPKSNNKTHKIDGISDGFIPSILDENIVDYNEYIFDEDAINMAVKFSQELGLGIGISSSANFLASVLNNDKKYTVTLFPDDNKKYLSILTNKKRSKYNITSDNITLITYEIV